MTRKEVIYEISDLLDNQCKECPVRQELIRKYKSQFAHIDGHCNKNCNVGNQLQILGYQLKRDG
ncbi:zinc-finger domain-containing protein [Paenibacillus shenyangensis]|uniref:zinc-finger domain-containing protein n=1 Tax=Paenibacillus sp. A9 TaxID=1284352 RepID=UPI0009DAA382